MQVMKNYSLLVLGDNKIVVADYKKRRIELACQILTSPDPTHCTACSPLLLDLNPSLLRLEGAGRFKTCTGHESHS